MCTRATSWLTSPRFELRTLAGYMRVTPTKTKNHYNNVPAKATCATIPHIVGRSGFREANKGCLAVCAPCLVMHIFVQPHSDMLLEMSSAISAVGVSNNNSANKWAQRQRTVTIRHVQLHQFSGLQCKHAGKLKVGKT